MKPSGKPNLSRRQFLGLAAGVATAAAAGPWAARELGDLVTGPGGPKRLVVPGELGIQLHTVRDAVARRDNAVVDPRTGSRLRGGFGGVFATLSSYGYKTVELTGYDQGTNGPITPLQIRALLVEHGLRAVSSHVGLERLVDPKLREREFDRALAVGAEWIGTPSAPASTGRVAAWQAAAEQFNVIGEAATERGLGFFHRTGHAGFDFFRDPIPDLIGVRRYQAFLDWTNPRAVSAELDVFSAYVARHRYPPNADGSLFDPVAHVAAQPHRYPLFHLNDGIRVDTKDGYTYTDVGDGVLYTDAFPALIELSVQNGYANFIVARDNAPGASNPNVHDPGRSFRTALRSAQALSGDRAGPDDDSWIDPIPELERDVDHG